MPQKTLEHRLSECQRITSQLRDFDVYKDCKELVPKMNDFVRDGVTSSGRIFLHDAGRYLEYQFSQRNDSFVVLRSPA